MLTTPPANEPLRSAVMDLGQRLFLAAKSGDIRTVRWILNHIPARVHLTHLADENLATLAESQKHGEIAQLIRGALAKALGN